MTLLNPYTYRITHALAEGMDVETAVEFLLKADRRSDLDEVAGDFLAMRWTLRGHERIEMDHIPHVRGHLDSEEFGAALRAANIITNFYRTRGKRFAREAVLEYPNRVHLVLVLALAYRTANGPLEPQAA